MQLTPNYKLKKPEGTDPVNIEDFNENAEILDEELKKKSDSAGGDISEMTVKTLDSITTDFPIPEAGEKPREFLGKVKKFFVDTKNWMTGVCLIGSLVNNCVTDNARLPLSAAQGKILMDLYTVLNTNKSDKGTLGNVVVNDVRTINLGNTGETVQTFTIPAPGTYIVFGSLCSFGTGSKSGLLGFEFNGSAGMDVYNQCGSYEDSTNSFRGLQHSSPVVVHTANASIRYRIYNTSTGSYTLRFIALRIK